MKVALIGYGYWGPNLAKNLNLIENIEFVGICEKSKERTERARSIYGNNLLYTDDYFVFLKDKMIDAIVIATPTEVSYQIAIDTLNAGKHLFIEKPIASTVERAQNIQRLAHEKNLIVHCDHIMLYHPVIRYVKCMIDSGELGELLYIDISRINLGPLRKDVNALLDLAVHDIAIIDFLSNGEEAKKISAMGQVCYGKQETLTYLTIKYKSFIAHIKSSWVSPIKERKTIIAGTKKMAVFDDVEQNKLTIYDRGIDLQMSEEYGDYEYHIRTGDIFIPSIKVEDSLQNSIEHFLNCISRHKESLSGPEHAIKVMQILDGALKQIKEEVNRCKHETDN